MASEQAFIVGSTNWSDSSILYNHETDVLVRHEGCRKSMGQYIDALWANSTKAATLKLLTDKTCAMYADGGYSSTIKPLLEGAKKEILLITYGMSLDFVKYPSTDPQVSAKRLAAAAKKGVKVRVLLEKNDGTGDTGEGLNDLNDEAAVWLASQGIEVRFDTPSVITHAKVLVVDGTLVLGTNNWGYSGFVKDHECGVRTSDDATVEAMRTYFEARWSTGSVP
jgi:phosphatidylserine/phosphatidylglycerophosphate/cardiolipin synthase-like enzyme